MPHFDLVETPDYCYSIWKVTEELPKLQRLYKEAQVGEINQTIRSMETLRNRLASRLALNEILDYKGIVKDPRKDAYGKLHLNGSGLQISISHCHGWACAILSEKEVGIDIEVIGEKVLRVSEKFCNEHELHTYYESPVDLHAVWGAKEAMYKAYGRKQLIFKEDMSVELPRGVLKKNGTTHRYSISNKFIYDNTLLIIALLDGE